MELSDWSSTVLLVKRNRSLKMLCVYMCAFACYCLQNTNLSALALIETFVSARGYTQVMCVCEKEREREREGLCLQGISPPFVLPEVDQAKGK